MRDRDPKEVKIDKGDYDYQLLREAHYPPIGDQLDAIMKWASQQSEVVITKELKDIADKCMAVKKKFPKKPPKQ